MASDTDKLLLFGFEEEAQSYFPLIRAGIEDFFKGQPQSERFEDALRYSHTLKGAAAMLELTGLSQMSRRLNIAFQALRAQGDPSQKLFEEILLRHITIMEAYLVTLMERVRQGEGREGLDDDAFVAAVEMLYRPDVGKVTPAERKALDATHNLNTGPLPELFTVFQEEAGEHLQNISRQLGVLAGDPHNEQALLEIRRAVHTLKGAGASLRLRSITRLAHRMEDLFDIIVNEKRSLSPAIQGLLQDSVDVITILIEGESDGLDDETAVTMCSSLINQYEAHITALPGQSKQLTKPPTDTRERKTPIPTDRLPPRPIEVTPNALYLYDPAAHEAESDRVETVASDPPAAAPSAAASFGFAAIDTAEVEIITPPETAVTQAHEPAAGLGAEGPVERPAPRDEEPTAADDAAARLAATDGEGDDNTDEAAVDKDTPPKQVSSEAAEVEPGAPDPIEADSALVTDQATDPEDDVSDPQAADAPGIDSPAADTGSKTIDAATAESGDALEAPEAGTPEIDPVQLLASEEVTIVPTFSLGHTDAAGSDTSTEPPNAEERSPTAVRVPIDELDELVRLMSEFVVSRSTLEEQMAQMERLTAELGPSISRLQQLSDQLAAGSAVQAADQDWNLAAAERYDRDIFASGNEEVQFDALEFDQYSEAHILTRQFTELSTDIRTVSQGLNNQLGSIEMLLRQQERLTSTFQERLLGTRMVPFGTLQPRLRRVVRTISRHQHKEVSFTISGSDVQIDKGILSQLTDPLLHLLRNAVDHGVEQPAARQSQGKYPRAAIQIKVSQTGNHVVIEVLDDGRGLDLEKIRERAVQKGLCDAATAAKLRQRELYNLLFLPGFSTRANITETSGRGVGLDIVKSQISSLQGTIALASEPGIGSRIVIRLPMALAVMRALIVRVGPERFAVPFADVVRIVQFDPEAVQTAGNFKLLTVDERDYPVLPLGEAFNVESAAGDADNLPGLIVNGSGTTRLLVVDKVEQEQEIVVKPLGNHLRNVPGIAGATLLGDGRLALIVNTTDLHRRLPTAAAAGHTSILSEKPLQVLIVDDSVSVRRFNERMVSNAGWNPILARDGQEALEFLRSGEIAPDIILLDVEMPRMDGYEFAAAIRGDSQFHTLPIIMITSRSGRKHRRKAAEAGASAYLVKPFEESLLRDMIARLTKGTAKARIV